MADVTKAEGYTRIEALVGALPTAKTPGSTALDTQDKIHAFVARMEEATHDQRVRDRRAFDESFARARPPRLA